MKNDHRLPIFLPMPFTVGKSDNIQGTRRSGASFLPSDASICGPSSSSIEGEENDNEDDEGGTVTKTGEDQVNAVVCVEVAATQKTTAQSSPKKLSSVDGKTSISPRKSSILPGYYLDQSPRHRRHMNIPTTREVGV